MGIFGITAAELVAKVVPHGGDFAFSVGDGEDDDLDEGTVDGIIEAAEAEVMGYLPLKYQRLLRRVEGEVVVARAAGGEANVELGVYPVVAGSLRLYRNYPREAAWSDRHESPRSDGGEAEGSTFPLAATEYVLTAATGAVALAEALEEDDRLWAVYEHTGGSRCLALRKDVLGLAAAEVARRCAYFRSAEGFDRFEQWEINARAHLRDVARLEQTLEVLEGVELVNETRTGSLGGILGGW